MHPVHAPSRPAADLPRYPAPVSARRALGVAGLLAIAPGGTVLDVAAGPTGLLFDVVARNGCRGIGLAGSEAAAAAARAAAEREGLGGRVEFRVATPVEFAPARRCDAILCVGAADGRAQSPGDAAARCLEWLRVGGVLVYGGPFLRRTPADGYRELLGAGADGLRMTGASACAVVGAGFELLLTLVLSESEWDAHASAVYREQLRQAASVADAHEALARRERADRWYQAYWKYGRDTLGYGLHAFRKPRHALHAI